MRFSDPGNLRAQPDDVVRYASSGHRCNRAIACWSKVTAQQLADIILLNAVIIEFSGLNDVVAYLALCPLQYVPVRENDDLLGLAIPNKRTQRTGGRGGAYDRHAGREHICPDPPVVPWGWVNGCEDPVVKLLDS